MDQTLRPLNQKAEAALRTLCDLSSKDMTALHNINLSQYVLSSHPSTLVALCRDKLIVEVGVPRRYTLTTLGQAVYERGLKIVNEGWKPEPYLTEDVITALNSRPPVSVASRIRKYLAAPVENHHVKIGPRT